jgi:hypothetical protein
MSGHSNTKGNIGFLKKQYNQNKSLGEKAMAFEFKLTIAGYPNLSVLCRSAQIPAMGRSDVEDFGASGLKFVQHGALENSGEISIACVETITGDVLKTMREIIREKKYVDLTMELTSESTEGKHGAGQKVEMLDCKLRCDVIEFSTEDTAALVKPTMTAIYNFVDLAE